MKIRAAVTLIIALALLADPAAAEDVRSPSPTASTSRSSTISNSSLA